MIAQLEIEGLFYGQKLIDSIDKVYSSKCSKNKTDLNDLEEIIFQNIKNDKATDW